MSWVVVVVGAVVVDVVAPSVDVVVGATVEVVVVLEPTNSRSRTVPLRLAAPGPGSDAAPSIRMLPVPGMQKTDPSVTGSI